MTTPAAPVLRLPKEVLTPHCPHAQRPDHAAASGAPPHSQTHAYHDRQDVAQRRPGKRDREEVRQELHHRLQVDPTLPAGGIRRHLAEEDGEEVDERLGWRLDDDGEQLGVS